MKTDEKLQAIAYLVNEGYTVREILDMSNLEVVFTMSCYNWIEEEKEKERKKAERKGRRRA